MEKLCLQVSCPHIYYLPKFPQLLLLIHDFKPFFSSMCGTIYIEDRLTEGESHSCYKYVELLSEHWHATALA